MLIQSVDYKLYNVSVRIIQTFYHDIVIKNQDTLIDHILN